MAKKKKKEEFEASLMGGYLPGVKSSVMSSPVSPLLQITQRMPDFLQARWRYGSGDISPPDPDIPMARQFLSAWGYYGMAGVADPKNFAEASAWSRTLGIPYLAGYGVAGLVGFFLTGTILTVIDPLHKWEGGLDETAFYHRRVTDAAHKPAWGTNDPWFDKANEQYGWGVGAKV